VRAELAITASQRPPGARSFDDIAPEHALWVGQQSPGPFAAQPLDDLGRPLLGAGVELDRRAEPRADTPAARSLVPLEKRILDALGERHDDDVERGRFELGNELGFLVGVDE